MEKILKIEADSSYDNEVYLNVVETSIGEELLKMPEYELESLGLIRISDAKGNFPEYSAKTLCGLGWLNAETAKKLSDKKVLEEKYYLLQNATSYGFGKMFEIDPTTIDSYTINHICQGALIVQKVDPKSVLSESGLKQLKAYEKVEKQKKEKANKQKALREEKKKRKEIENAKKLLQEAGELECGL